MSQSKFVVPSEGDAEYALRSSCVKIPSDIPMAIAALIGCGVLTGVGAALNTTFGTVSTSLK